MLSQPPDLLILGALTIDRFGDGSLAPGGSVLHAGRAAADAGYRVAAVALAGSEPPAADGLAELAAIAALQTRPAPATVTFRHEETAAGRRLWLEVPAARLDDVPRRDTPPAVLFAPVAGELGAEAASDLHGAVTGAILQGWLRELVAGELVRPLPLRDLAPALVTGLAHCDVLIASREDLLADAERPPEQLDALRRTFGDDPALIVTDATAGAWVDAGGQRTRVPVPRVVRDVPMVGAGDAYAALLLGAMGRGRDLLGAARDAAAGVAEMLAARSDRRIWVMGDVHGMDRRFAELLREAGLTDAAGAWTGGHDELWCLGDLVDRGPGGAAVIRTLRRLDAEAAAAGGRVSSVIGNHEVLLLAARTMPDEVSNGPFATFREDWIANGGIPSELDGIDDADAAWLAALPAVARVGEALLVHADAGIYLSLGRTVGEVNERMAALLAEPDPITWDGLLGVFSERYSLRDDPSLASRMLARFGGRCILHGHTPIARFTRGDSAQVRAPHAYAEGRVLAVDPGMPLGGPGFLYRLGS